MYVLLESISQYTVLNFCDTEATSNFLKRSGLGVLIT